MKSEASGTKCGIAQAMAVSPTHSKMKRAKTMVSTSARHGPWIKLGWFLLFFFAQLLTWKKIPNPMLSHHVPLELPC